MRVMLEKRVELVALRVMVGSSKIAGQNHRIRIIAGQNHRIIIVQNQIITGQNYRIIMGQNDQDRIIA